MFLNYLPRIRNLKTWILYNYLRVECRIGTHASDCKIQILSPQVTINIKTPLPTTMGSTTTTIGMTMISLNQMSLTMKRKTMM